MDNRSLGALALGSVFGAAVATLVRTRSGRDLTPAIEADEVGEKIEGLITNCPGQVVIFSKSYCPYCRMSKALLDSLGITYCAIELDQTADGSAIQAKLLELTNQRTVPSVFVNGQHLGGNDDLHDANRTGKLQKLLETNKA